MTEKYKDLYKAFLKLKTVKEAEKFCYDLMTPQETADFVDRLQAAQKLEEGLSQRAVSKETGVSIATVTRVNRFLNNGKGGYKLVLERMKRK